MSANDVQIGGNHYQSENGEQHWDRIYRLYGRGYFIGCSTKYLERYHLKNGKQDLEKAIHFIEKLIELEYPKEKTSDGLSKRMDKLQCDQLSEYEPQSNGYVNQDGDHVR